MSCSKLHLLHHSYHCLADNGASCCSAAEDEHLPSRCATVCVCLCRKECCPASTSRPLTSVMTTGGRSLSRRCHPPGLATTDQLRTSTNTFNLSIKYRFSVNFVNSYYKNLIQVACPGCMRRSHLEWRRMLGLLLGKGKGKHRFV